MRPLFRRVRIDDDVAERLQAAAERGDIVYTLRAKRLIDPLYILHALDHLGLPVPSWIHDHPTARNAPTADSLVQAVEAGRTSLLFLRRPRTLTTRSGYSEAHVEALVAAQRRRGRPILLVPVGLQWQKKPTGLRRTFIDAVFGDRESPGATRELLGFVWQAGESKFHVGAPVDLSAVLEDDPGVTDERIARKVRWTILHHLAREERLRTGPVHRSPARTRQAVRQDPQVRRLIESMAGPGKRQEQLEAKAETILRKMAADMRYGWIRFLDAAIELIWNRIYDGIQVDEAGLDLVRRAARKGPVVVVPSHKSHVDYLVLSQVFFKNDLIPPHIAAGENLDFWPMGFLFRRGGAFFIRRSFRGDKLYAALLAAYVRRLLREGHAVEFFIEGGRSRTGKLLPPKMGMLAMCADPVLEGSIRDVSFVPVSIGYEKVIEAGSYAQEIAGGRKRKEDVKTLVSSARILGSRYGRVYVDFGEPVSLRHFAVDRGLELPLGSQEHGLRKQTVSQLGHRIVYGINRVTRVTPTSVAALVLLSGTRQGMGSDELLPLAEVVLTRARTVGARVSSALEGDDLQAAIQSALQRFVRDRLLRVVTAPDGTEVYRLEEKSRVALDFYKNNILHFFVPTSIVACALRAAATGEPVEAELEVVKGWALRISQLLKNEVSFRVGASFEDNFDDARQQLESWGVVATAEDRLAARDPADLDRQAGLLGVFFTAALHLGETFGELMAGGEVTEKMLLDTALAQARRQAVDGRLPRAEAGSQPVLRQALSVYLAEGALVRGERGVIEEGPADARLRLVSELEQLARV